MTSGSNESVLERLQRTEHPRPVGAIDPAALTHEDAPVGDPQGDFGDPPVGVQQPVEAQPRGEAPPQGETQQRREAPPRGEAPQAGEVPQGHEAQPRGEAPPQGETQQRREAPPRGEAPQAGEVPQGHEAQPRGEAPQPGEPDAEAISAEERAAASSALEALAAERDEYLELLRRLQADFDNYRKRVLRQQTELLERAAEALVVKLLPVLDALELARVHLGGTEAPSAEAKALLQAAALLDDILFKEGLERIDAVGVPFDPTAHDAVEREEPSDAHAAAASGSAGPGSPKEEGPATDGAAPNLQDAATRADASALAQRLVLAVLRPGYRWKGKVIRPAMVRVSA
jgi:molecular chaperone GrpE